MVITSPGRETTFGAWAARLLPLPLLDGLVALPEHAEEPARVHDVVRSAEDAAGEKGLAVFRGRELLGLARKRR